RELDSEQPLFWAIHGAQAPLGRRQRRIRRGDRVGRVGRLGGLVVYEHAVRGLVARLPVHSVGAEEAQAHASIAGALSSVVHGLRPVLAVAWQQDAFDAAQSRWIQLGVDVGAVGDVVAGPLQPLDEVDLPTE